MIHNTDVEKAMTIYMGAVFDELPEKIGTWVSILVLMEMTRKLIKPNIYGEIQTPFQSLF